MFSLAPQINALIYCLHRLISDLSAKLVRIASHPSFRIQKTLQICLQLLSAQQPRSFPVMLSLTDHLAGFPVT